MWLQRYRLLVVVFSIGLVAGAREYLVSRRGEGFGGPGGCEASAAACFSISPRISVSDSAFWRQHAEMAAVVAQLNPNDPDTDFIRGMQALAENSSDEFSRRFEEAIDKGVKHNHFLLQYNAQYLLESGADWRLVNEAVNRWRENHPFSAEPISLRLSQGPRDQSDVSVLERALADVPWIAGSQLLQEGDGAGGWRLLLTFHPARTVDMRQAVAAVTTLALPEQDRQEYEVICETLQDCRARRKR